LIWLVAESMACMVAGAPLGQEGLVFDFFEKQA
jgi:hypothetical protein